MTTTKQKNRTIEDLAQEVQFVKGVGPQRAELLNKLGLRTVTDLIFFFPRKYEHYGELAKISELQENQAASVVGEIVDIQTWKAASGTDVIAILLDHEGEYLRGLWFNQQYLKKRFEAGQCVMLQGTPRFDEGRWVMTHAKITWFQPDEIPHTGAIVPQYRLTAGLNQRKVNEIIHSAIDSHGDLIPEVLPESFRAERNLLDISTAIHAIHHPEDHAQLDEARRRFVYQELFVLQCALAMRREKLRAEQSAIPLELDAKIRARILGRFPFELSDSQASAVEEICADLSRSIPMNRLLHGEVGSGKTAVAIFAMLLAVAHGHQAVLMAPTELLALQHVRTLQEWLKGTRVHVEAWTGSVSTARRRQLREEIADGRIQIVVGTHALLHHPPDFQSLAIAVVDEQHKFGVRQRAMLREAGGDPHYLVMTATPIPRTIAMTAFGDLDVSTLQRSPAIKQPVHTYLGKDAERDSWWEFVRKKLSEGRQAFVIAPLVDSQDEQTVSSAERLLEQLMNGPLEAFRLDLLHGRQSISEKESAILGFVRGHTQVLISTTVVEVGIDVPNATIMTIESAERFGLSQLHQLRGRVSRGDHPGFVCVFPSSESEDSLARLQAFVECQDGFELAEQDLATRGPGNFFSKQQHGLPPLRIADLIRDDEFLKSARGDAQALIESDPNLTTEEFTRLRKMILARYGTSLELSDVG